MSSLRASNLSNSIFVDVTFLFDVAGHLTGISRVIFRTVEFLLREHPELRIFGFKLENEAQHTLLGREALSDLLRKIDHSVNLPKTKIKEEPVFSKGDLVLFLGEQWLYPKSIPQLSRIKSEFGLRFVTMIHDLVPYFSTEFYWDGFPESFINTVDTLASLSSGILVYSNSTHRDVIKYLGSKLSSETRIGRVSLGSDEVKNELDLPRTQVEPYVLSVGTIQPRKNHMLLLYVWRQLLELNPNSPKLVLVGKVGWNVGDLIYYIANNPLLKKKIEIRENLKDEELKRLFHECLFTIYPSFYEGWGLPIAESLSYGRACLASNSSSMPEVGGDLVEYFSPYDSGELYRLVKKYIDEPGMVKERETQISTEYRAATWSQMVSGLVRFFSEL